MTLNPAIAKILDHKRAEVETMKRVTPTAALLESAAENAPRRSLADAVTKPSKSPRIIAEIKRSSPSRAFMPVGFDPVEIARAYEAAGAVAISTLTDARFFSGAPSYVPLVRQAVSLPVLRKDFIIDKWQVAESAALGADAVLVMAVCFPGYDEMAEVFSEAQRLGMEALVEIHSPEEWEKVKPLGPKLVGVNNRDFMSPDLKVDIKTTIKLAPALPENVAVVSESGIGSAEDIERLQACGVDAFLIGSSLMREADPGAALAKLTRR